MSIRLFLLLAALKRGTVTLKQVTAKAKVNKEAADNHRPEMALPGAQLDDSAWYEYSKAGAS